jgi:hypothetical protein
MLGQYAGSGEAYLYWVKAGALELAASLDDRDPPEGLERVLSAAPANDQFQQRIELPHDESQLYTIVRLGNAANGCVGLAALREVTGEHADIPEALIIDIGRALAG